MACETRRERVSDWPTAPTVGTNVQVAQQAAHRRDGAAALCACAPAALLHASDHAACVSVAGTERESDAVALGRLQWGGMYYGSFANGDVCLASSQQGLVPGVRQTRAHIAEAEA